MEQIDFFDSGDSDGSELFRKDLIGQGYNIIPHQCLCDFLGETLSRIVIAHPHDELSCLDNIRKIIQNNPDSHFCIFPGVGYKREKIIGKHANVIYLDAKFSWSDFLESI